MYNNVTHQIREASQFLSSHRILFEPVYVYVKDKVRGKSTYAKSEWAYKRNDSVGTHGEQSTNPKELSFTQLGAKTVELSELIEDKLNMHQSIKNMIRAITVRYNGSQEEERNSWEKPKPAVPTLLHATQLTPNHIVTES